MMRAKQLSLRGGSCAGLQESSAYMNTHPVAISVLIVAVVAFVGAVLYYFRDKRTYQGHEEYADDVRKLAKRLVRPEIFRDGDDLVISATWARLPVVIRFSYADNTPGLDIRMQAPSNFTMSVVPKGARASEGRVAVKTPDDMFDARFTTRSDHPTQAKMFLAGNKVMSELVRLCCSAHASLTISHGTIEQTEAIIPGPYTARHVFDHIDSMSKLASELGRMPGAESANVKPLRRERRLVLRTAIVIGAVTALGAIIAASHTPADIPISEIAPGEATSVEGILPNEALQIGQVKGWHGAKQAELDPDALSWARAFGQGAVRLDGDFTGKGHGKETAYLLVNNEGQRRIVVLSDAHARLDMRYPWAGILTRIPKPAISRIEWIGRAPETPDGDALMIIRKPGDRTSGLVLYLSDGRLVSGVPKDYQAVPLNE